MRIARFAGVLLMTLAAATGARAEFGTIEIAPAGAALTFARAGDGDGARLILVSVYADGKVSGIDVTAAAGSDDPITAYGTHGYDGLAALSGAPIEVALADLTLPARLGASHVAAGTNFPEHGKEATVTDGPFLFPK